MINTADIKFVESKNKEPITCIRSAEGVITMTIYSKDGDMGNPIELDEENAYRLLKRLESLLLR